MSEIILHPIYTLDSLFKMGVCDRITDVDENTKIRYDFKMNDGNYFNKGDLNNLQDTFKCDGIDVYCYYDEDAETNLVLVELRYVNDLMGICKNDD